MKKLFCLLLMCVISQNVYAGCPAGPDKSACPVRKCPAGAFMGDDGKCYACDEKKDVDIGCIGWEEVYRLCPSRKCLAYGMLSRFCPKNTCPKGAFMGDDGTCYACDERNDIRVMCIGEDKASELCPNRLVFRDRRDWKHEETSRLCPKNTCPKGAFMGDDGKCYACDEKESIPAVCFKYDLPELCPNRIYSSCLDRSELRSGFQPTSIDDYYPLCSDC